MFLKNRGGYRIGNFDGEHFIPETDILFAIPEGAQSYAAQTWENLPEKDGRRIQISWAHFDLPGMPFNGFMTFPCELTLRTTENGVRLFFTPVKEIENLYKTGISIKNIELNECSASVDIMGKLFDLTVEFEIGSARYTGLNIRGINVNFDAVTETLSCKSICNHLKMENRRIKLRVLVDRTSIEIFANDGTVYMPVGVLFDETGPSLSFYAEEGFARISFLELHELQSIWENDSAIKNN